MATADLGTFFRRLTRGMAAETLGEQSDARLVERALAGRDEAAFQAIVSRHGAMVYRVSWRVLHQAEDAEDAFQATFLILARRLRTLRRHASLASWLHGVAHRVALKARAQAAARRRREQQAPASPTVPPDDVTWKEMRAVLDAELVRLPERWRLPLVLCYLEGRTQDEAAAQLGWSKNTLRRRLDEARQALGRRLSRRGVGAAALAAMLVSDCTAPAATLPGLIAATVEVAAGGQAVGVVSPRAIALTEGVLKTMLLKKILTAAAVFLVVALLAVGGGWLLRPTVAAPLPQAESPAVQDNKAPDGDEARVKEALQKLEGTWVKDALEWKAKQHPMPKKGDAIDGTWDKKSLEWKGAPKKLYNASQYVFKGDKFTYLEEGKEYNKGDVKLDPAKNTIDLIILEGKDKGVTLLGLYEVKGDTLRIGFAPGGEVRPKELKTGPDSDVKIWTYQRQAKKEGAGMNLDQLPIPKGPPPRFVTVAAVDAKKGEVTFDVQVPQQHAHDSPTLLVYPDGTQRLTLNTKPSYTHMADFYKVVVAKGKWSGADGKELAAATAIMRLTPGTTVVLSADGAPVDPAFLGLLKDDTLVLTVPADQLPVPYYPHVGGIIPVKKVGGP